MYFVLFVVRMKNYIGFIYYKVLGQYFVVYSIIGQFNFVINDKFYMKNIF